MAWKQCFIPKCKNNSLKYPEKIFAPLSDDILDEWCREANVPNLAPTHTQYCCEEHFDPKKDLVNYLDVKFQKEPKLKPTASLRNTRNNLVELDKFQKEPKLKPTASLRNTRTNLVELDKFQKEPKLKPTASLRNTRTNLVELDDLCVLQPVHASKNAISSTSRRPIVLVKKLPVDKTASQPMVPIVRCQHTDLETSVTHKSKGTMPEQNSDADITCFTNSVTPVAKSSLETDSSEQIDVKICRMCLATNCRLYSMTAHKNLNEAYGNLTGLPPEDELPRYLCAECSRRLLNCADFRRRGLRAHLALLQAARVYRRLTVDSIRSFIGDHNPLGSYLSASNVQTDHYDLNIQHEDSLGSDQLEDSRESDRHEDSHSDQHGPQCSTNSFDDGIKLEEACVEARRPNVSGGSIEDIQLEVTVDGVKMEGDEVIKMEDGAPNVPGLDGNGHMDAIMEDVLLLHSHSEDETSDDDDVSVDIEKCDDNLAVDKLGDGSVEPGFVDNSCNGVQPSRRKRSASSSNASYQPERVAQHRRRKSVAQSKLQLSCELCPFRTGSEQRLFSHLRAHGTSNSFKCDKCFYRSVHKSSMESHALVHERNFCKVCGKRFKRSDHLAKHMLQHKHSCSICNGEFQSKDGLRVHLQLHFAEIIDSSIKL